MKIEAEFPDKLKVLFEDYKYKVARGGRGSAKSWSFARALLLLGARKKVRILCAREVQLSIKQSVHKLLKDQIELLGLTSCYTVLDSEIRGNNGTEIAFSGLSTLTIDTIKSFEGYDICWVEEGQSISKRSWDILDPTIRKDGSEIWISYNPDLETDETHQRFTINPPDNTINVEMNWRDNPWFNELMNSKRLHSKKTAPDDYDNIWEGKCRPAAAGAIYYKQMQEAEDNGRICNVPYDPMLKVHVILDLGWEDSLSCAFVQKNVSEIRVIEYLEAHQTTLNAFSDELRLRSYNWGKVWLPHDGFNKTLNAKGKSTADILRALGWNVILKENIVQMSVEEGIRTTRLLLPRMYFDKEKTNASRPPEAKSLQFYNTNLSWRLIESIKRYKRQVNRQTESPGAPLHDQHSHGADTLRYISINADKMTNDPDQPFRPVMPKPIGVMGARRSAGARR